MDLHFSSSLLIIFTSLLILAPATTAGETANDTAVLSLFRSQTDIHGTLLSNWTTTTSTSTACSANWLGVNCTNHRVTAVTLPSSNLRGPVDALSSLDQLRVVDLRGNRLNGSLTPVAQCVNLKLIYLSGNDFSGEIPEELSSLHRLRRLDLSNNNLRGPIPTQFANLSRLLTLHLQNNAISGTIPKFLDSIPLLKELNLSNNELYGAVPKSVLSRYGVASFSGNEGLCGTTPFPNCSYTGDLPSSTNQTVPSNPSSLPSTSTATIEEPTNEHHKKLSNGAIVAIVVANSVLVFVMASFAVAYCCGKSSREMNSMTGSELGKRSSYSSEKRVYANNGGGGNSDGTNATDKSTRVF